MTVNQVATIVNDVQRQIVGENAIQTVDLTGLIDMGKQALDATSYDNYVKTLVDHIGKVVFVNRAYQGSAPSVLMDGVPQAQGRYQILLQPRDVRDRELHH